MEKDKNKQSYIFRVGCGGDCWQSGYHRAAEAAADRIKAGTGLGFD